MALRHLTQRVALVLSKWKEIKNKPHGKRCTAITIASGYSERAVKFRVTEPRRSPTAIHNSTKVLRSRARAAASPAIPLASGVDLISPETTVLDRVLRRARRTAQRDRSTESIIVASLVWTNVLYCGITLVTYSTTLQSQRFITIPEMPPSLRFCIKKLARATCGYYAVSVFLIFAWGVLVANTFPVTWRWMRLDFYAGAIVNHIFAAAIARATKRTYDHETCKGHLRRQMHSSQHAASYVNGISSLDVPTQSRSFWRVYSQTFPKALCAMCTGGYVQIASQNQLFPRGASAALIFAIVSFVIKLLLQELTKVYVMKRNIHQIRAMDAGKMALIEIVLRAGKMVLIKWQIRRRVAAVLRACFNSQVSSGRSSSGRHSSQSSLEQVCDFMTFSGEFVDTRAKLTRWKQQMLDFHTAEVMADMYTEYIAIACSASILFFFFDHPKYHLGSGTTASKVAQLQQLLVSQLGLEIVVNCVSCVCEIAGGVHFERVRKFNVFLAFMFKTITVVNIGISSFLYLK
ncbi:hypothetical protein FI667_g13620, partial [Globisporangium splendens]